MPHAENAILQIRYYVRMGNYFSLLVMKNVLDGEAFAGTLLLSAGSKGIISQNV